MDFNLNANDRSQGWKFSLSHQQAQESIEKQRKSGRNEMQLKTGREAWKNSKTGILANSWQSVGNHCEFRNQLAISWQPLPISQSVGNLSSHCEIRKPHALFICLTQKLQNLSENSHCQLRKPHCQFRKPHCQLRKPLCQIRNPLPNSQTHCQIRKPLCQIRKPLYQLRNSIAKFAIHCQIH